MKKAVVFLLILVMALPVFSGCGQKDETGIVYVGIHNAGYGVDFIDTLGARFEEKTGIKVKKVPIGDSSGITTPFESGTTNIDLYLSSEPIFRYLYGARTANGVKYDPLVEDLTDIMNEKIPGEDKSMLEKMLPNYKKYHSFDKVNDGNVKYYSAPWINGMNGIVINNKMYNSSWSDPRTTDELIEFCDKIKNDNKFPFIYSLSFSYWNSLAPVWAAQYDGEENVDKYDMGYAPNGVRYSPELMLYPGFLESLNVMEKLLDSSKGYMHEYSKSLDFTQVQSVFLNGEDSIVMMPNGDWLEREMSLNYDKDECDIRFMKFPVVSALKDKLGISESELRGIIDYADGIIAAPPQFTSSKSFTNEQVVAEVVRARKLVPGYSLEHSAFVPAYANEKQNAKKFLQFMASDEGLELFVKGSNGYTLPYSYDYLNSAKTKDEFSKFNKNVLSILKNCEVFEYNQKDRLFSVGYVALPGMNIEKFYEKNLSSSKSSSDYRNAEKIFTDDFVFVSGRWDLIKSNAGISSL